MDIRPFRGWHYRGPEISTQIAPPYDILTQADKDAFLEADPTNIVAVDLPHCPPKSVGPDECYKAAAKLLARWQKKRVLFRDNKPALYAYEQSYSWCGRSYVRRAMLCGVRATPLGVDVIPHEHTFAGPKADRLKLTTVTKMQLSPIFGFYEDPIGVTDQLLAAAPAEPTLTAELRGVTEKLWVVTEPGVIAGIHSALEDAKVYIADGHHRYTTAMNFCQALRDGGLIDEEHEANFVLFALVARNDPGLLVLPTHRVIRGLDASFRFPELLEKLKGDFDLKQINPPDDLSDADAFLEPYGKGAMALLADNDVWIAQLRRPEAMAEAAPDQCDAWRTLDVAVLHKLIIEKALAPWNPREDNVEYTPNGNAARQAARSGEAQAVVVLQGTPLQAVEAVADAGQAMPHKSTYFYPKLATGMILKPVE
ncbi:MAG: DUF1015 domain-containing protein [Phycisphaerae bacterium]|nr:DUF1015 domain-containing protein [Phycisphaerae bacterium]